MKKTYKHPDGTEEILDGTPEEIAQLEKLLREKSEKKQRPDVLKGVPASTTMTPTWNPCKYCGENGCMRIHILCDSVIDYRPNLIC